jgi:uncharacterized protein YeaO (DUF488 family)
MFIRCKRIYLPPNKQDSVRILVERLWPRGITKKEAALNHWVKDVAPSPDLRRWFGHDFTRWEEFQQRYRNELDTNTELINQLLELANESNLTLVYASKDKPGNSAQIPADYLCKRLGTA